MKNINCHIEREISKKDLHVFLGIWAGIFAVFLGFGIVRHDTIRIWALCGVVISIALLATPRVIVPFYNAWLTFGNIMGFVISRIILAIIFFGIFTPLGIIFRLFKRDILGLKLAFHSKDKSQSLFKIRETQPTSMKNQF
ncbi:SxtJ family membrane protein [Helicobacter sp. T3_23-1056]